MSFVHAIAAVTEYKSAAIKKKQLGQSCFIDLQIEFDTLNHEIFLQKMENYGFRAKILNLIASFLNDRSHFVYHNGRTTSERMNTTVVPQGSVLGPFRFLLYIKDLLTVIGESQLTMFADGTSLLKSQTGSIVTNYPSMSGNVKLFHLALGFHKSLIFWRNLRFIKSHPNT